MPQAAHTARQPLNSRRGLLRWAGWFLFFNTPVLVLIGTRYLQSMPWPDAWLARSFVLLSMPGHFVVLAMVPMLLLAPLTLVLPWRRLVMGTAVGIASLGAFALVVDSVVFGLFRFHLNGMVWSLFANGGITEIVHLSLETYLIAAGVAVAIIAVELALAALAARWIAKNPRGGARWALLSTAIVLSSQFLHAWADASNYVAITREVRYLPAFEPLTMKGFLQKHGIATASASTLHLKPAKSGLAYPLEPLSCTPRAAPLNVLIIAIDSWRWDMLTPKATPHIWALAQDSIRFTDHLSSGNSTRFGIFGLFYGVDGTYWHAMLGEERGPVLIDEMLKQNFQFGVFASAPLTSPEFDRTVFSAIRGRIDLQTPGDNAVQRDRAITDKFARFLDTRDRQRPFSAFLFYDSTHSYAYPKNAEAPFQPVWKAVNHLELGPDFDPTPYRNRFLNAAHYVDGLVGRTLDRLKAQGLLDRTVVLVTGDHGEEFNETGGNYWGHNSNFSRYQVQVPMVVHWPGRPPAVYHYGTSHVDIAPTLLKHVLGCSTPVSAYSDGADLFSPNGRDHRVVATWDKFSVETPGRIDVVYKGYSEAYDEHYRPLPDAPPLPARTLLGVMDEVGRFYAK